MRVLFLNQTYLPDPVATSQYLGRWAEHLAREGHDVTVMTSRRAYHDANTFHPARETREGVRIIRVGSATPRGTTTMDRIAGFISFLLSVLVRGLFTPKPDTIVALTTPPLLPAVAAVLAKLRGARLVVWATDLHPETAIAAGSISEDGMPARIIRKLSRWSLRRANRIVVPDDHMRRTLFLQGIAPEVVEVIPLWMQGDLAYDAVGRATVRRARGWDHKFVVMCAGDHGACDAMETLLTATDTLRDDSSVHFCWVGGGSQWPALQQHAARNVSLLSYAPREKVSAVLSAADLHVVVTGDGFTGLAHPGKVYPLLATRRPFLHIGPDKSPVADVIRRANLGEGAACFRHGDRLPLVREIRRRAKAPGVMLSAEAGLGEWQESACLEKMTSTLGLGRRLSQAAPQGPLATLQPGYAGTVVSATGSARAAH